MLDFSRLWFLLVVRYVGVISGCGIGTRTIRRACFGEGCTMSSSPTAKELHLVSDLHSCQHDSRVHVWVADLNLVLKRFVRESQLQFVCTCSYSGGGGAGSA